jgi:signal peptidase II
MKMITGKILRRVLVLSLVLFNIGCDQVTKSIVRKHVDYNESIKIISNNFTLTKVENSGAFLSSGEALPVPVKFVLLSLLPLFVLGFGIYYILSKTELDRLLLGLAL